MFKFFLYHCGFYSLEKIGLCNEYLGLVPWVIYDNDGGWESEVEREIVIVEDGNCFVEKNRDSRDLFKNKMVN